MKLKKVNDSTIFVRADVGEDINKVIEDVAKQYEIPSASISVIGAIEDITLGYYDPETKSYINTTFEGEYELAGCMGSISWLDGQPFVHLHAQISDKKCQVFGGHLFSSKVAVTGEIFINVFNEKLDRVKKGDFGLIEP